VDGLGAIATQDLQLANDIIFYSISLECFMVWNILCYIISAIFSVG